jgi:hypothetical protein
LIDFNETAATATGSEGAANLTTRRQKVMEQRERLQTKRETFESLIRGGG